MSVKPRDVIVGQMYVLTMINGRVYMYVCMYLCVHCIRIYRCMRSYVSKFRDNHRNSASASLSFSVSFVTMNMIISTFRWLLSSNLHD